MIIIVKYMVHTKVLQFILENFAKKMTVKKNQHFV